MTVQDQQPMNRRQRRSLNAMQRSGKSTPAPVPSAQPVEAIGDGAWDDLERVYLECRALSVTPAQVLPLLKDSTKLAKVKNPAALVDRAKVLSKDVAHYNERLESIHTKHAGQNGSSDDPDTLMKALSIGEEYQEWLQAFQTVVMPVVAEMLEQFDDTQE